MFLNLIPFFSLLIHYYFLVLKNCKTIFVLDKRQQNNSERENNLREGERLLRNENAHRAQVPDPKTGHNLLIHSSYKPRPSRISRSPSPAAPPEKVTENSNNEDDNLPKKDHFKQPTNSRLLDNYVIPRVDSSGKHHNEQPDQGQNSQNEHNAQDKPSTDEQLIDHYKWMLATGKIDGTSSISSVIHKGGSIKQLNLVFPDLASTNELDKLSNQHLTIQTLGELNSKAGKESSKSGILDIFTFILISKLPTYFRFYYNNLVIFIIIEIRNVVVIK